MTTQGDHSWIGSYVDDRFIHLEGTLESGIAHAIVSADAGSWFVVEAVGHGSSTYLSVLSGQELLDMFETYQAALDGDALDDLSLASILPDVTPSYELEVTEVPQAEMPSWVADTPPVGQRTVIVDEGIPTGVVDAPKRPAKGPRWLSSESQPPAAEMPPANGGHTADPPGTPPPEARAEQHLLAETTSQLRVSDTSELRVTLSGAPESGALQNSDAASAFVASNADLMIVVRSRGSVELDDQWRSSVTVQNVDEAVTRKFGYRAVMSGVGSLSASLFSGSEEVATVELSVVVSGDPRRGEPVTQGAAAFADLRPGGSTRSTLMIDKSSDSTLLFNLVLPGQSVSWHQDQTLLGQGQAADNFLSAFEAVRGTRRPFENYQRAEMIGVGSMLADLLPDTIKNPLWEQRDTDNGIELLSTLAKWPWELCCLANGIGELPAERPFLGQRGLTRRRPGTTHPLEIDVSGRRVVSAPDYTMLRSMALRAGAEEALHLQQTSGFVKGPTGTAKLTELLNDGEFSIFHFTGHSVLEDDGLGQPKLVLNDSKFAGNDGSQVRSAFSPTMLQRRPTQDSRPLIFLNACTTGGLFDAPPGGDGVRGFADGFFKAGAGAFIGTQWEVEDGPAKNFAASFYREFLENDATLSDAVSLARGSAGNHGWSPSPLAYLVYGNPDARAVEHYTAVETSH